MESSEENSKSGIGKVSKYTTLECRYTSKKQLKLVARSIKYQDDLYASTTERIKRQSLIIYCTDFWTPYLLEYKKFQHKSLELNESL